MTNNISNIEHGGKFDTVVVGGGMAGVCAAISAARLRCSVALIQDRPVLGGNSSSEIRVSIGGAEGHGNRHARESGIIEELRIEDRFRNHNTDVNGEINSIWDMILWEWVQCEPNITLYLNTSVRRAVREGDNLISGVIGEQLGTEKTLLFEGDIFIDCSGDGQMAADAGAEFRMGREARHEHNESLAPEAVDSCTLGSSILFESVDVGRPVKFNPPDWAHHYPTDESLPFRHPSRIKSGFWWIEFGGMLNTIRDNDAVRDELWKHLYGVWDHIKNHGDHRAENYALDWVGAIPGKRESRRFIGDHILTQSDLEQRVLFDDRVAYGGWPIDLHPPKGIYHSGRPAEFNNVGLYSIPFRSLYSRNIDNLMMAGRHISVTHVALGSPRLIATCAVEGQAVGTAAYFCKKYNAKPRDVYKSHISELQQQLLKDDCYIIQMKNDDLADIARNALVDEYSSLELKVTEADGVHHLDCMRAQMFIVSDSKIRRISLLLESTNDNETEITAHLRAANSLDDFSAQEDIAVATATVPPRGHAWVTFTFDVATFPNCPYWVWLPPTAGIGWCFSHAEPLGAQRSYKSTGSKSWMKAKNIYCFQLSPASLLYSGQNVVNGIARPEDTSNIWISDPELPFPQHIDLDLGEPQTFNTVYLTFDTNLDKFVSIGSVPQCVKDYTLHYEKNGEWVELLSERENHHRRRIHTFDTVQSSKMRVQVNATNGADTARIYEVRVYEE